MATTMNMPTAATGTDKLPSGSWTFGPLTVQWSIKPNDEVDVDLSVFGIDVDTLSGTLTKTAATIANHVDVLGIVKGDLSFTAKFDQGSTTDGLWIGGQIKGPGFDSGVLNHRIIPW
jgi:hypothetical protein